MIICAAIKLIKTEKMLDNLYNSKIDMIVCGHRHSNCFSVISELDPSWIGATKIQGFMNHKGEFLDRKEAFEHVKEIGQCNATQRYYWEDHNQTELYSEDLY
jgi:hypothetical protein